MKDPARISVEAYVYTLKPGLGYEIDRNALDNRTKHVERVKEKDLHL